MKVIRLLIDAGKAWIADKAPQMSAALAFYSIFSLGPLLILAIAIAGVFFGEDAAKGLLENQLTAVMGERAAGMTQNILKQNQIEGKNGLKVAFGLTVLLLSASGVFGQLKVALNVVWNVRVKRGASVMRLIRTRVLAITMVLGVGLLLMSMLILSAVLAAAQDYLDGRFPVHPVVWQALAFIGSVGTLTVVFAAVYRILPDAEIRWSDVWLGAAITALLIAIGKEQLALYLGRESVVSGYGAAGAFVLILFWIYYSSLIFLYGAEFTHAHATSYRSIPPSPNAVSTDDRKCPDHTLIA